MGVDNTIPQLDEGTIRGLHAVLGFARDAARGETGPILVRKLTPLVSQHEFRSGLIYLESFLAGYAAGRGA